MMVEAGAQLVGIGWVTGQNGVAADDAAVHLVEPDDSPKLDVLTKFALSDNSRMRFKQTDQLVVLSNPGGNPTALRRSSELLSALWLETVALRAGTVKARFDL